MTAHVTDAPPVATTTYSAPHRAATDSTVERPHAIAPYVWGVTRISLGFVFLWAFVDKMFGLGFATPSERAWINGGSPTTGFLSGVEGTFSGLFQGMAGNAVLDWLFMLGLFGIGAALMLGIGMWVAAVSATAMLVFMWMASLPLETNPFLDDHLVYALVAIGLAAGRAGDTLGLGRTWASLTVVKRLPFLR